MRFIEKEEVIANLDYPSLVEALKDAFINEITVPNRLHFDFKNPKENIDSTLLLMPAWQEGVSVGAKVLTVSPNNAKYDLPAINGIYILFDAHKGELQAIIDGKPLTSKRTAAASALASSYLSKKDASSLLMIGTGALSSELIKAHSCVRDLKEIYIWGRNKNKALKIAEDLGSKYNVQVVENIEDKFSEVDIVSCATLSATPLIFGKDIKKGQHFDLVGAYKPDMREADDEFIKNVDIFIDTNMAKKETGEIKIPLDNKIIFEENIKADLFDLTRGIKSGRVDDYQITLFKSVGHGLEDLAAARLVYEKVTRS